jgi:ribosomal protein S18 acetylase RimI-like enzyme
LQPIEIRQLGPGDTSVLDRVAPDVFDHVIDAGWLVEYLREPGHVLFVALSGGEVVGQARGIVHRHPDAAAELYIDNLGVTPAFQRRGIGRDLISALLREGKARGCREAWVATEENNIPARALYRSFGSEGELCAFFSYRLGGKK